jgi:hypothetical protein
LQKVNNPSDEQESSKCIECECGSKIELSSNVNEMSKTIVSHAENHAKTKPNIANAKAEESRIEHLLIAKVFKSINSV